MSSLHWQGWTKDWIKWREKWSVPHRGGINSCPIIIYEEQKQVSRARKSNCIPQNAMGCNYSSMPEIPVGGAKVLNVKEASDRFLRRSVFLILWSTKKETHTASQSKTFNYPTKRNKSAKVRLGSDVECQYAFHHKCKKYGYSFDLETLWVTWCWSIQFGYRKGICHRKIHCIMLSFHLFFNKHLPRKT